MSAVSLVVLLHVFSGTCFNIANGITVTINEDVTGTAGTNGTYLECNYSRENVKFFLQVVLQVKINETFHPAVTFDVDDDTYINQEGEYLRNRISFQNITRADSGIKIYFDELLCIDKRVYRCKVRYLQIDSTGDDGLEFSTDTHITVQVPPSPPSTITIVQHDRKHDTNITSTTYFTTPETNDRSDQGTSLTAIQQPNVRDALDSETYVEGDRIKIVCAGYVGNPPENLTVRNSITNVSLKADDPILKGKENCSFSQSRSFTLNLTAEDNNAVFRCAVTSLIHADGMFIETSPIVVHFITKQTTPIMSTPVGPEKQKIENKNKIYYVIGGVGGGAIMIIILVVAIIKCRGKRTKAPTMEQQKSSSGDGSGGSLVHLPSKRQTMEATNYYSVSLDDDGVGRGSNAEKGVFTQEETKKHNEKYLKEQNEKNSRNEDRGGHQPVEYAMVNKSYKSQSSKQQNDQHQHTEYAQVNKVQKTTSYKSKQGEDHYASGQDIYDRANDRRHKQTTDSDPYDTPGNINRRISDKVGSVVEITGEPIKQKQVAKVKPSGRFGYENASMIPDDVMKKKEELNTEL